MSTAYMALTNSIKGILGNLGNVRLFSELHVFNVNQDGVASARRRRCEEKG